MLDFKVSQKTETKTQINKKLKKTGWVKKTFLGLAVFSLITASSAAFIYKTEVSPEVAKITKTIDKNKQYLSHVDKSLFSTPYTDAEFQDDLRLFSKMNNVFIKDPRNLEMRKRTLLLTFNRFVYFKTINPSVSYDDLYQTIFIDGVYSKNDSDDVRQNKYKRINSLNNKIDPSLYKRRIPEEAYYGLFGPTNFAYDNIVNAFKSEYGEKSIADVFMTDGSKFEKEEDVYQKHLEKVDKLIFEIENAYKNKDYDKIRVVFKQSREFYKYIAGLDLGNNQFSQYSKDALIENNIGNAVQISLMYSLIKNKDNSVNEIIASTRLY